MGLEQELTEDEKKYTAHVVEEVVRRTTTIYKEELERIATTANIRFQLIDEHIRRIDARVQAVEEGLRVVAAQKQKRKKLSREAAFGIGFACATAAGILVVAAKNTPKRRISE